VGTITIVTKPPQYALAVVLASDDPARLYSGLSLLVSTAGDGARCAALATFRGLELLTAVDLERRAEDFGDSILSPAGRVTFARSLVELRDTALAMETIDVYACAATAETTLIEHDLPVMSTPRFLRETAGARLLFI
jgi:peroxiredoxin family protein